MNSNVLLFDQMLPTSPPRPATASGISGLQTANRVSFWARRSWADYPVRSVGAKTVEKCFDRTGLVHYPTVPVWQAAPTTTSACRTAPRWSAATAQCFHKSSVVSNERPCCLELNNPLLSPVLVYHDPAQRFVFPNYFKFLLCFQPKYFHSMIKYFSLGSYI